MKKFRIAALVALVFGVFTLTGCGDLWNAAKVVTKNKWTTKTVSTTAVGAAKDSANKYNINVYLYYTDEAKTVGNLSLGKGLNVLIEADAGNANFFGDSISTASYAIKTFAPGETISNNEEGSAKKEFKVTDDAWAGAYALGLVTPSGEPLSANGSYELLTDKLSAEYWKEFMAEKIIDLLLG